MDKHSDNGFSGHLRLNLTFHVPSFYFALELRFDMDWYNRFGYELAVWKVSVLFWVQYFKLKYMYKHFKKWQTHMYKKPKKVDLP